jgi:penicillin-binding protein 1A
MRTAVRNRPVEEFDTDLKLPDWQVEPDDEWMYGDPGDEYYYVDEQGNLIQPGGGAEPRAPSPTTEGERPAPPELRPIPSAGATAPPAASDEFLERATGREIGETPPVRRGGQ